MRRTLTSTLLSLAAHAVAVALLLGISQLTKRERPPRVASRPVSLRALPHSQWEKNRGQKPEPVVSGQVVDVATGNLRRPKETKYLAETNNTVAKQTRAREQTAHYRVAAPQTQPARGGVTLSNQLEALNAALDGARPRPSLLLPTAKSSEPEPGPEQMAGAAPNDALEDEAVGDATALNTREWRFASFMNRVKQAVAARWDPNGRLRTHEPRRQIYAPRTTVLGVALRPDGTVVDLYVVRPCGIESLDLEAVSAFERAAPFPNPPAGLVEDGAIRFQFTFTLTADNGFISTFGRAATN